MKLGIQQTALHADSLGDGFEQARKLGADGVGLCYRNAVEASLLDDPAHLTEVKTLTRRHGLAVSGLTLEFLSHEPSLIGAAETTKPAMETIRKAMAVAARLGQADVILPFLGRNRIELPKEYATAGMLLSSLADDAEGLGVVLAVESTMPTEQMEQLLMGCGSDFVKACVDTGELVACRHDPASMILGLGVRDVGQVHVKDVLAIAALRPDFNVRLGRGHVNLKAVAHALASTGYDRWLVLETPPGDANGDILRQYVQQLVSQFQVQAPPEHAFGGSSVEK